MGSDLNITKHLQDYILKNGLKLHPIQKEIIDYRFTKNGKAKSLTLDYTKLENDNFLVTATARDKDGLRALDFENRVYFQCLSGGETKKYMGTPTGSEAIEMANGKASIEVTRYSENIPLKIMVLSQDFKGTYLTID